MLLRVPAELKEAGNLEETPVKIQGGHVVRVRDLGRVEDGLADRTTYARMNGQPAVSLRVKKSTGANIVGVADAVREIVERQAEAWPDGVEFRILADQSVAIRSMVTGVAGAGGVTACPGWPIRTSCSIWTVGDVCRFQTTCRAEACRTR